MKGRRRCINWRIRKSKMSLNIFEIIEGIVDFICLLANHTSSDSNNNAKKIRRKSKYTFELWSGGFLVIASILFFIVFKNPLPNENLLRAVIICSAFGLTLSFTVFFLLYQLDLYYFRCFFTCIFFSGSLILLLTALVLYIYFRSNLFSF